MFFIGRKTTAELQLTTPLEQCCNCGAKGEVELVQTPLQKTRYFLFFGTELELIETFPYCKRCQGSAKRVRLSWPAKLLVACMVTAGLFLGLVLSAADLPSALQNSLFAWSCVLGVALTLAYFFWRERKHTRRSYYQPVSLVDAVLGEGGLQRIHLRFVNPGYARVFSKANAPLIAARLLKVEH
jgi:hypothetical protein